MYECIQYLTQTILIITYRLLDHLVLILHKVLGKLIYCDISKCVIYNSCHLHGVAFNGWHFVSPVASRELRLCWFSDLGVVEGHCCCSVWVGRDPMVVHSKCQCGICDGELPADKSQHYRGRYRQHVSCGTANDYGRQLLHRKGAHAEEAMDMIMTITITKMFAIVLVSNRFRLISALVIFSFPMSSCLRKFLWMNVDLLTPGSCWLCFDSLFLVVIEW